MFRSKTVTLLLFIIATGLAATAQYKGDDIPGFLGLQSGTQAPPGLYAGNLLWVYPTSTIKDNSGNKINQRGSLTSTLDGILLSGVSNWKFLGANYGASIVIPFIANRLQLDSLNVNSGMAFTDMIVSPLQLGWHRKRADFIAAYNMYLPTGKFESGGTDNTGLGIFGNEFSVGSTLYLDDKKQWSLSGNFALEFHTNKRGTDIQVGDMATIQGGLGKTYYHKVEGPIPMIMNAGVDYYAQFKVTGDSGSDIPPALRGYEDRVYGIGPEFNIYFPKPRLTLVTRYEPEFGARVRSQGQTAVFSLLWVAKSLVKMPPPPSAQPVSPTQP
jgi:hypothetical protein